MSIRVISKQQFSDGTTIDGNRIEEALQQLEEMCDEAPAGRVKRRFLQSQVVVGFAPFQQAPYNKDQQIAMDGLTQNRERFKGYRSLYAPYGEVLSTWFWETSFQVDNPAIISAIDCFMQQDMGAATPNYQLPGGASGPYVPPTVFDVLLYIIIDAPFVPEDRSQADMLIHKYGMDMDGWLFSPLPPSAAPDNDMLPAFPGGNVSGWAINLKDLNLPIPRLSRVRMALGVPLYAEGVLGDTLWGQEPWKRFSPSLTMTMLEPLGNV